MEIIAIREIRMTGRDIFAAATKLLAGAGVFNRTARADGGELFLSEFAVRRIAKAGGKRRRQEPDMHDVDE